MVIGRLVVPVGSEGGIMLREIQNSVEIARPVGEVFEHVTTPDTWKDWSGPVLEVQAPEPGPLKPDAEFVVVAKLLGRRFETHAHVTGYEHNRLLSYTSPSGPLPSTFTWDFESVEGATTRVTQTIAGDEERTSGFFKLAFPLVEAATKRQMRADLATLKELLESRT
jgi:uncharacterized protein YndB with AHSA1/START domain